MLHPHMGHGSRVTCQPHRKVIDRSNDRYLTHKCGQWQSRVQLFSFLNCFLGEEGKKIKETRNLQILFCKDKLCVSCCIYIYISINFSKKQEETINRREREKEKREKEVGRDGKSYLEGAKRMIHWRRLGDVSRQIGTIDVPFRMQVVK